MVGWLVDERGIEPHVKLMDKSERADGTLSRSDFVFDAENNLYVCPNGKELRKYHRPFSKPRDGLTKDGTLIYRPQLVDEVFRVIGLVGAERDRLRPVGARLDHVKRRYPLGMTVGQRQAGIDQQAVVVSHEAQLRLPALPFAVEPGLGIGGRGMRVVRSFLAVEVPFGVASAALGRPFARAILRFHALHGRPRLDQRAVHREVAND
jgi:hypothetical protein